MSSKHANAWFNKETNEVHTPKCRIAYESLLKARGIKDNPDSKPSFSVTLMVPADANLDALKELVANVAKDRFGTQWEKVLNNMRYPTVKPTEKDERLAEHAAKFPWLISAKANLDFPPFIFGPDAKKFSGDQSDVYRGRWAVAAVRAYPYDTAGNKGVGLGLQRIQLLDHDEPISGARVETASGFEAVDTGGGATSSADDIWK